MNTILAGETLELKLSLAVATNQLPWICGYTNIISGTRTATAGNDDGESTDTSVVTILAAPSTGMRQLTGLSVYNADNAPATVTIQKNTGTTTRVIGKWILKVGDSLIYTDKTGFKIAEAGSPITIILAEHYHAFSEITGDPADNANLVAYISSLISVSGNLVSCVAGSALSSGRAVIVEGGKVIYFDPSNEDHAGRYYGVTKTSASAEDETVLVQTSGSFSEVGLGLTADILYFIGANGTLSATAPASGVVQIAGMATGTETIEINKNQFFVTI